MTGVCRNVRFMVLGVVMAAGLLAAGLLAASASVAAEIKVMVSGGFFAACKTLQPEFEKTQQPHAEDDLRAVDGHCAGGHAGASGAGGLAFIRNLSSPAAATLIGQGGLEPITSGKSRPGDSL